MLPHGLQRGVLVLAVWSMAVAPLPVQAGEMQVQAREMRVQGRIIDVVPIGAPQRNTSRPVTCEPQRPDPRADLAALLAWDLRADCNTRHAARPAGGPGVSGYRVYYRWDGRTFQHVVRQPPVGDTISLRVRVD